jgi:hypothetical protein
VGAFLTWTSPGPTGFELTVQREVASVPYAAPAVDVPIDAPIGADIGSTYGGVAGAVYLFALYADADADRSWDVGETLFAATGDTLGFNDTTNTWDGYRVEVMGVAPTRYDPRDGFVLHQIATSPSLSLNVGTDIGRPLTGIGVATRSFAETAGPLAGRPIDEVAKSTPWSKTLKDRLDPGRVYVMDGAYPQLNGGQEGLLLYTDVDGSGTYSPGDAVEGYACASVGVVTLVYVDPLTTIPGAMSAVLSGLNVGWNGTSGATVLSSADLMSLLFKPDSSCT